MTSDKDLHLDTLAIHAGQSPDPSTGAVMTPIYATSTYVQQSPGVHQGFEYSRSHNPTRFAYERCVAALERGTQGYAFASGLAATATVLDVLDAGSHVVCMDDVYGGTYRLFERVRKRSAGLSFDFVNLGDMACLRLLRVKRRSTSLRWAKPWPKRILHRSTRSRRAPSRSAASMRWCACRWTRCAPTGNAA